MGKTGMEGQAFPTRDNEEMKVFKSRVWRYGEPIVQSLLHSSGRKYVAGCATLTFAFPFNTQEWVCILMNQNIRESKSLLVPTCLFFLNDKYDNHMA